MANDKLSSAKTAKNDEFYTQYPDIQKEMNALVDYNPNVFRDKCIFLPCDDPEWSNFTKFFAQNFQILGIRKLISTSYAPESKKYKLPYQPTLFETSQPYFDIDKSKTHGKIFILDRDITCDNRIDINDLRWEYLDGDGDFRSKEIANLLKEADIIATNPPFSLFREFIAWLMTSGKQFIIIGNMNAVTYKEIFPLIKNNKIWVDNPFVRGAAYFTSPLELNKDLSYFNSHDYREGFIRVPGVRWFTNIELGRRHEPLQLMTMAENFKHSKHKEIRGRKEYIRYENYDAIEVPFTDAIPKDYKGIMGVPKSYLDKHCPEQYEIVGCADDTDWMRSVGAKAMGQDTIDLLRKQGNKAHVTANMPSLYYIENERIVLPYARILIRKKE